jgi:hypothetical protein
MSTHSKYFPAGAPSEAGMRLATGAATPDQDNAATPDQANASPLYRVAAISACLALAALLVGGVGMALTTAGGTSLAGTLVAIDNNPLPFLAGGIGLVLVSLFDIFTVPGLHSALGRDGRILILLATVSAIIGDLLGILGRLAQTALVPLGLQAADNAAGLPGAALTLSVLDTTLNTAGFLLVSVSFTCFGLLMLRGFSRLMGWIAIVAGVFTLIGQIPVLTPLFAVANVAYIAWYVGLGRRFWRAARTNPAREGPKDPAMDPASQVVAPTGLLR